MIAKSPDPPVKSQAMRHVDDYLEVGQKAGASDVHLARAHSRDGVCMVVSSQSGLTRRY